MKRRRKRIGLLRLEQRAVESCPSCGHSTPPGQGRLIDPRTRRAVCVRCGSEFPIRER